ncbi:hypothetical protein RHGRI_004282 [Rhododendron griersonianum]|uniref:GAG-pre-integrase domain-containing protein n=1 Tax=Rhododendron griersonianum TaxID=479676 RepID=A0AAV6L8B9_9ERIC|nr:hypothetical protein RHGRI_004282 [Rhododendron griersonianum]
MHVVSIGSIQSNSLSLSNVFYVPQLTLSLVSISQLSDSGFDVVFSSSGCVVQDRESKKQTGTGRRVGDLYTLERLHIPTKSSPTAASSFCLDQTSSPFYLWHSRLGHLSSERLKLLAKSGSLEGYTSTLEVSDIPIASSAPPSSSSASQPASEAPDPPLHRYPVWENRHPPLFTGIHGKCAFLNGNSIEVSSQTEVCVEIVVANYCNAVRLFRFLASSY